MSYILVIWTAVAAAGYPSDPRVIEGWRPIGEFSSQKVCADAGKELKAKFHCLKK